MLLMLVRIEGASRSRPRLASSKPTRAERAVIWILPPFKESDGELASRDSLTDRSSLPVRILRRSAANCRSVGIASEMDDGKQARPGQARPGRCIAARDPPDSPVEHLLHVVDVLLALAARVADRDNLVDGQAFGPALYAIWCGQ